MRNVILPLALLSLYACQKPDQLTWTERRMLGSWTYDDVDFTESWSIGKQDITHNYNDISLTFYSDFTVTSSDAQTGETHSGIWEVNIVNVSNNSNNSGSSEEQLIASLSNDQTGEVVQLIWENLSVTKERILCNHNNKDGWFTFRLEKL